MLFPAGLTSSASVEGRGESQELSLTTPSNWIVLLKEKVSAGFMSKKRSIEFHRLGDT